MIIELLLILYLAWLSKLKSGHIYFGNILLFLLSLKRWHVNSESLRYILLIASSNSSKLQTRYFNIGTASIFLISLVLLISKNLFIIRINIFNFIIQHILIFIILLNNYSSSIFQIFHFNIIQITFFIPCQFFKIFFNFIYVFKSIPVIWYLIFLLNTKFNIFAYCSCAFFLQILIVCHWLYLGLFYKLFMKFRKLSFF